MSSRSPPRLTASSAGSPSGPRTFRESTNRAEAPAWSATGGGTFQFGFTNAAHLDFTALTSTNLALPLTNWSILGNASEISPGQYQFTDASATNAPQRFYRVVSP